MADILWEPSEEQIENANMTRFMNFVNQEYSLGISSYEELYKWSIENIPDFWAAMWSLDKLTHWDKSGGHDFRSIKEVEAWFNRK